MCTLCYWVVDLRHCRAPFIFYTAKRRSNGPLRTPGHFRFLGKDVRSRRTFVTGHLVAAFKLALAVINEALGEKC